MPLRVPAVRGAARVVLVGPSTVACVDGGEYVPAVANADGARRRAVGVVRTPMPFVRRCRSCADEVRTSMPCAARELLTNGARWTVGLGLSPRQEDGKDGEFVRRANGEGR